MKLNKLIIFLVIFAGLISCKKQTAYEYSNTVNNNQRFIQASYKAAELQDELRQISKTETPSVVFISTETTVTQKYYDPFDFFFNDPWQGRNDNNLKERKFKQSALGSGLIYKRKNNQYYILTNNHVIENADAIKVTINETKSYKGKIVGTDPGIDIAIISIKTKDDLVTANIGDSGTVQTGDFAIAVGNPFGLNGTMTFGIISAVGRNNLQSDRVSLTDFIQTDAAINPGNSGGPLLNINGEVIGINTLIYSQSGGNIGIGFAIPINIARNSAEQIIENGKVEHGFLGIFYRELNEEDINQLGLNKIENGMLITQIIENSPAEKYGLKSGDVIVEVDNSKLLDNNDLAVIIGNHKPGEKVVFKILRNNEFITKVVSLGIRDDKKISNVNENRSEILEEYGLEIVNLTPETGSKFNIPEKTEGVLILKVQERSRAGKSNLRAGDIIFKVNNTSIKNIHDIKNAIKNTNMQNYFYIYREGRTLITIM